MRTAYVLLSVGIQVLMLCPTLVFAADGVLSAHIWKHRVVVVNADRLETPPARQIARRSAELSERHIIWYVLDGDRVDTNAPSVPESLAAQLRKTYFRRPDHAVVVIGKDGGVKRVDNELDLESVFALIDGMPMRRREMRQ